jgi:hypothetical protein
MNRLAWLLPALLSGCLLHQTPFGLMADRTSPWLETGPVLKPRDEIVRTVRDLMIRHGYQVPEIDAAADHVETGWDTHLSTLWREGNRTMVEAEIVPLESGRFNVRIRSTMEINDNSASPAVEEKASWIPAGVVDKNKERIGAPALRLQAQLKVRFFGLNP